MKITFTTETHFDELNPELISKLSHVTTEDELLKLEEDYGYNEVEDAIFAIASTEEPRTNIPSQETITNWLWEDYYEQIHDYVVYSFLNRHKEF